jgi:oligopeptide transport system permease protein
MARFVAKRLLGIVLSLWLVATLVFLLLRLVPGGPFDSERTLPPDIERALASKYHLDLPLWRQYLDWLRGLVLHGDLGPTFRYAGRSVNEIIGASLPVSMQLGAWAMLLALCIGIPLGVVGAVRHGTWADTLSTAAALVGISLPRFVLAPLLVFVFSLNLYWLPAARWETWRHMVLPVVCAALPVAGAMARLTRGGMLEVIHSDWIRTARAKGLSERRIVMRHALRGGLLPLVSYLGPGASSLLVGSVVIEKIFNVPGMGRYFVEAALNRDYNLVMGVTLVYGAMLMVLNAAVDVAYGLLDPRVRLE